MFLRSHFGTSAAYPCGILSAPARPKDIMASAATAAEYLIFQKHGRLLRMAGSRSGRVYSGLQHIKGDLYRAGCSDKRLLKQLLILDHAYSTVRHITQAHGDSIVDRLEMELQRIKDMKKAR